jgi:hypothetical protein
MVEVVDNQLMHQVEVLELLGQLVLVFENTGT